MTQAEKQYEFDFVSDDPDGDLVPFGPPVGGDDSDAELPEGYIGYATSTEHADEIIRRWNCHAELLEACQEAEGVLTEPGMMDVDEWKAWQKRVVVKNHNAIAKATTD